MNDKIGYRIKIRREELGLSQEELAKKLKYRSRSSINKIEHDASGLPQNKIVAIATALETTPAYIMGWDEEVTDETKENNDSMAAIIVKMRMDKEFLEAVKKLSELEPDKLAIVNRFLNTFIK